MLFKILHGDPSKISFDVTPFHEGYCYVTHDGFFYVDLNIGTKEIPNNQRLKLNAKDAETLTGMSLDELRNEFTTQDAVILHEAQSYIDEKITAIPQPDWNQTDDTQSDYIKNKPKMATLDDNGTLVIENGIATEGCTAYAKAGSAIGIKTYSGSKAFTIWGLGEGSTIDADEGTYLVDGIEVFDENGERIYGVEVGDDYSCHVCYTNATTSNSRQRSFYGKVTAIEETEQVSPAGRPLYAITVSPFFGLPADSTFRPFITNEDGTISDEEPEYLDTYGVDQERNTFRIPSKPLLGDRILGAYAYATGYASSANTRGGFTSGVSNIADGNYGAAIGFNNKAAYAAIATGNNTKAIGIKSFTQGANTEAYQEAASAMGVRTKVDGFGAHGTGVDVTVNGRGAQGEGISNTVSGNAAHGEGQNVEVNGVAAHGEGDNTNAIGPANHSEGKNTTAGMKWTKATVVEGATAFELDKEIDGFAVNDVYTILQTNRDTSYVDAGKITGIDGKTITVDVLPTWKDEVTSKQKVMKEATVITFDKVTKSNGDVDVVLKLSNPLDFNIGIGLYTGAEYDNNAYGGGYEGFTYTIEAGTASEVVDTFPGTLSGGNLIDVHVSIGDNYIEGNPVYQGIVIPNGYDYELPEPDVFKLLKEETVNVSQAVHYFGVRKKPTIGAQTFGEAMHAEGRGSNALATGAHASGIDSVASNINTFAHGQNAKATSRHAIALGDNAQANGAFSIAAGQFTKTENINQTALGKYNDPNTKSAVVVGWGTKDTDRKNIFEIETSGNVKAASFNGYTIKASVPSDAKFTDTTYDLYASKNSENGDVTIELDSSIGDKDIVKIQGSGSTTVTTDADGVITINSIDTNVQSNWNTMLSTDPSYISNKPNIKAGTRSSAVTIGNVVAENISNTASGDGAVAAGRGTRALANSAFAAGINTVAQGRNSLTTGDKGIAWADNTFVSGSGTLYNGTFTSDDLAAIETAWQNGTNYHIAANNRAAVFGQANYAKGENSLAIGQRNKAGYKNQFVTGQFNNYNSNALFMIGDGAHNAARSNAFEVFGKNGTIPAYATIGGKKVATEEFVAENLTGNLPFKSLNKRTMGTISSEDNIRKGFYLGGADINVTGLYFIRIFGTINDTTPISTTVPFTIPECDLNSSYYSYHTIGANNYTIRVAYNKDYDGGQYIGFNMFETSIPDGDYSGFNLTAEIL